MTKKQTEDQVSIYEGLEGPRHKPGMYLGSNGSGAIYQGVKEVTDNAFDEALADRNDFIGVCFDPDGSVTVWDHGGGVPVGKHKKTGRSTFIEVFARLHAGSKMGDKNSSTDVSTGTHGVGAACTNAISEYFHAWTFRDKKWWEVKFKDSIFKSFKKCSAPTLPNGSVAKLGTIIKFKPDLKLLAKGSKLDRDKVVAQLEVASYLYPNVKIYMRDNIAKTKTTFHQPDGYRALLKKRAEDMKATLVGEPIVINTKNLSVVAQWSDNTDAEFESYVNGSRTIEGGTHLAGFNAAFAAAIEPYKGRAKFKLEDLRIGLLGILNYKMAAPSFDSQTKEKLKSEIAKADVEKQAREHLTAFFKKHKKFAKEICSRAAEFAKHREEFTASKKLISDLKTKKKDLLPSKLKWVTSKDPKEIELFLVEGDSANGTCTHARDNRFQAVLALRGKFINVYGAQKAKMGVDETIINILRSIGYDASAVDPVKKLRVGKIILLADEDEDGHHITVLILSLLNKVLPAAFVNKHVYIVNAPLFTGAVGSKKYYAASRKELLKKVPKGKKLEFVTRIKGWGEVSPELLKEVAFNKATRSLTRISELSKEERLQYASLVGTDSATKRKLLGLSEKGQK